MAEISQLGTRRTIIFGTDAPHVANYANIYEFSYDQANLKHPIERIDQKKEQLRQKLLNLDSRTLNLIYQQTMRLETYYTSLIEEEIAEKSDAQVLAISQGHHQSLSLDKELPSFISARAAIIYARNCTEGKGIGADELKEIQRLVVTRPNEESTGNRPGQFRIPDETVVKRHGKIVFRPPHASKLDSLMIDLLQVDGNMIENDYERAGLIQIAEGFTHFFVDGNGRTVRPHMTHELNSEVLLSRREVNYRVMDFASLSQAFCDPNSGGFRVGYLGVLSNVTSAGWTGGHFEIDQWMSYFTRAVEKSLDLGLERVDRLLIEQQRAASARSA